MSPTPSSPNHDFGYYLGIKKAFGVPWGTILKTLGGRWTGWNFYGFQGVAQGAPRAQGGP